MKAKKIIIPVSIVAGIAVIGTAVAALGNAAASVSYADTIRIEEKSLENKISVSGVIESADTTKVYAEISYPVESVNVSVGDFVKKGDVLCTIKTDDLEQQILQQQAAVDSSGVNTDYSLSTAEQNYADALADYQNGDNASIIAAEQALRQAEKNLETAKRSEKLGVGTTLPSALQSADSQLASAKSAYEESVEAYEKAVKELNPETHPASVKKIYDELQEAKQRLDITKNSKYNGELETAQKAYDEAYQKYRLITDFPVQYSNEQIEKWTAEYTRAKTELEAVKASYDEDTLEDTIKSLEAQYNSSVESLEAARDAAETAMENAKRAYENAQNSYNDTSVNKTSSEEDYSIAVKNAEEALADAQKNYDITVQQVETQLSELKKQAEQQRTLSGLNDPQVIILQNLKDDLECAVVTAPCDGVITAVNAEEGVLSTGALFVIEDLNSLRVAASVGEYDVPYVDEGMSATIRCDAVDGVEYDGKITSVAPTATASATSSGVNYKIEADIDGEDGKILVGMSAKVTIISDRRENALTVTYDALTTDENGNDAVYIAEKDENGVYHAKLVTVEIGLETDYEIEIVSDQISVGTLVLTDTTMISDGDVVMINDAEQVTE